MKLKLQTGDRQLIVAVIIWLITSTILFYSRFSKEFEEFHWTIIIAVIFFYAANGVLMALGLGIWNLILMITSGSLNPNEVGIFANKDNWTNKEIIFHFFFGWPIGCFVIYGILRGFGII